MVRLHRKGLSIKTRTGAQTNRAMWLLAAGVGLWGGVLSWLSVARYNGYNVGMLDLGNMAQAIASVQRGQPLIFTFTEGPSSRLALHVELIYFLFAPMYALVSDPRLLLAAQALLFVLGAIPVYRLAQRSLENQRAASLLVVCYLLYPVALTSVLFDFHGDTLAMPLLLFMLDALDRRAWRQYAAWLTLALLCKFYVAATIILLGFVIWRQLGEKRVAIATSMVGGLYAVVSFGVIRPLFTTTQTASSHRGLGYIAFYFGEFGQLWSTLDQRLISLIVVFTPLILLVWYGRLWLLPALPIAAAALLSTGPGGAYDYRYHHYALVVPFVMMAAVKGAQHRRAISIAARQRGSMARRRSWFGDLVLSTIVVAIFTTALVDTPLNPLFWLRVPGHGLDPSVYGRTDRDRLKDHWLRSNVPSDQPIAASNFLAPHLVDRETLYLVRYADEPTAARLSQHLDRVDYAFPDALFDFITPVDGGFAGGVRYDLDAIRQLLQASGWGLTSARDGLLRFERDPQADRVLQQNIQLVSNTGSAIATFGESIALLDATVEPVGERRFRATFRWRALRSFSADEQFVAVSELEGVNNARIVHLPSYAIEPTNGWQAGQVWQEQFDVQLPPDIPAGRYAWRVGWYDTHSPYAAATDDRSRVGNIASVTAIDLR